MVNTATNTGLISQIIGPVVDVEFSNGKLPQIYSALKISNGDASVICEVQQLLGNNKVRAVSMTSTDPSCTMNAGCSFGCPRPSLYFSASSRSSKYSCDHERIDGSAKFISDQSCWTDSLSTKLIGSILSSGAWGCRSCGTASDTRATEIAWLETATSSTVPPMVKRFR